MNCKDLVRGGGQGCGREGEASLLIIFGIRVICRSIGQGTFHCQRCGGDRGYRHKVGRRWFTLCLIPIIPLNKISEHVQCAVCGTRYRMDVLAVPTAAQMQAALPAGLRAAATGILRAGGVSSGPSRRRAIDAIRGAGLPDYDGAALDADLAALGASPQPGHDLAGPLNRLAIQLAVPAREWFLAGIVRIGLADGPLTDDERQAAQEIAAHLGMTQAQARGVIAMTEESAPA
jgi:hypothetical protein